MNAERSRHRQSAGRLLIAGTVALALSVALNLGRPMGDSGLSQRTVVAAAAGIILMMLGLFVVGALILARRPSNPIGWLLLAGAWLFILSGLAQGYAYQALVLGRALPAAVPVNWLGRWVAVPAYLAAGFILLLFPNGHLPSRRWRSVTVVYAMVGGAYAAAYAAEEWPHRYLVVPDLEHAVPYAQDTLTASLWPGYMALFVLPLAAIVVRYRHGSEEQRAQIRWLALAGAGVALGPALYGVQQRWSILVIALSGLGGLGLPVAMAIAILRYRLYEIDRIISRTVTYGLVLAVLAGVYATGVVGLGTLLSARFGESGGDLLVAATTLLVVALFRPLRGRVQRAVERRFNRTGFLARQAVERLPQRLQDQVDVDAIQREITRCAADAVHPAHVSMTLLDSDRPAFAQGDRS